MTLSVNTPAAISNDKADDEKFPAMAFAVRSGVVVAT